MRIVKKPVGDCVVGGLTQLKVKSILQQQEQPRLPPVSLFYLTQSDLFHASAMCVGDILGLFAHAIKQYLILFVLFLFWGDYSCNIAELID